MSQTSLSSSLSASILSFYKLCVCVFVQARVGKMGGSCFDFPRRLSQASSLSDSNLYLKRGERCGEELKGQRKECASLRVCLSDKTSKMMG